MHRGAAIRRAVQNSIISLPPVISKISVQIEGDVIVTHCNSIRALEYTLHVVHFEI